MYGAGALLPLLEEDAAEVLNFDCRTSTADDVSLFKEKQKFMRTVFDKTLQPSRGKKHVRDHNSDYNDESDHKKLNEFHTKSTNSRISASTTLSYITPAKIES